PRQPRAPDVDGHVLLVHHPVLRSTLDVRLVGQRLQRVPHPPARLLYLLADRSRDLAHATSSFTVSMVCSGTGGVASWIFRLPISATRPPMRPRATATTRAATAGAITRLRARLAAAVAAPTAASPAIAATPNMPAPTPRLLPFSASSAFASWTSWRTRVPTSPPRSLSSSPVDGGWGWGDRGAMSVA